MRVSFINNLEKNIGEQLKAKGYEVNYKDFYWTPHGRTSEIFPKNTILIDDIKHCFRDNYFTDTFSGNQFIIIYEPVKKEYFFQSFTASFFYDPSRIKNSNFIEIYYNIKETKIEIALWFLTVLLAGTNIWNFKSLHGSFKQEISYLTRLFNNRFKH